MTTGERIKAFRISLGMSQEELGELIGVKKAAINKYETGLVVNLKRSAILKLADALHTTPACLMGWDEPQAISNDDKRFAVGEVSSGAKKPPNNIRYVRKLRKLTTKELGEKVGVVGSAISQYETGRRQPDNEMLLKLAKTLRTTVDYLLGAENEPILIDINDKQLLRYLKRLQNDHHARILIDLADGMTTQEMEHLETFARFLKRRGAE